MKRKKLITWICRIIAAGIMLQTLWFKFTAAPESVYIFSKLHLEPGGRIIIGIVELIAAILILIPRTSLIGALVAIGIMAGAIISDLFILGVVVQNDGGLLFALAISVLLAAVAIVWTNVRQSVFLNTTQVNNQHVLDDLVDLLLKMSDEDFTRRMVVLSESSVGQHVRHCIDMYNCVFDGYKHSTVNYNARKRDTKLSDYVTNALENLLFIIDQSAILRDKSLWLTDGNGEEFQTSLNRELLYCNEHAVHHMALIKIAIKQMGTYEISAEFGVAPSTIKYQKVCA